MLRRPSPSQRPAAAGPVCTASMLWHIFMLTRMHTAAGLSGALLKILHQIFPQEEAIETHHHNDLDS